MTSSVVKCCKAVTPIIRKSSVAGVLAGMLVTGTSSAAAQVSSLQTSTQDATAFTYKVGGIEYRWGMGQNQLLEGFTTADGHVFSYAASADRVELMRDDIVGVTSGEPCGIFVERLSDTAEQRTFAADYPSDGSGTGNCDIASLLSSRVVNRGAVDLFSNTLPDAKNIERLDYVFDSGVLAPFTREAMQLAGHLASEKSSNNPIKIAAILSVDILGKPSAYGPLQTIGASGCSDTDLCYGITDLQHTYSFLQNDFNRPQSYPVETERSQESVGIAFVSAADLGLNPGQTYYGFSFFADDVDVAAGHNLLEPSTFPNDTSDEYVVIGDDADIYGGLSGYFLAESLSVAAGAVFNDVNGDGVRDAGEAGISDIRITLFEDVNGNGVLDEDTDFPLGGSIDSDVNGGFVLPGIPEGNFLVVMDESDPELPPGLVVPFGSNPRVLTVSGADPDAVFFPFIDPLRSSIQDELDGGLNGTPDPGSPLPSIDSSDTNAGGPGESTTGGTSGSDTEDSVSGGGAGASVDGTDPTLSSGTGGTPGAGSPLPLIDSSDTDTGGPGEAASEGTSGGGTDNSAGGGGGGASVDGTDTTSSSGTDGVPDEGAGSGSSVGGTDTTSSSGTDGVPDEGAGSGTSVGGTDTTSSSGTDGVPGEGTGSGTSVDGTEGTPGTDSPDEDSVQESTSVTNDIFSINQGSSASFDVLENDVDGAGGGLTLISVSSSSNATISTVNNEVAYQPNFGFYGIDTFLYTLMDADGIRLTGNVRVDVLRYSDINENSRNDFDECDCTDLTLQTGVNGAGAGQLSLSGLLVMLMSVFLRRWPLRAALERHAKERVAGAKR